MIDWQKSKKLQISKNGVVISNSDIAKESLQIIELLCSSKSLRFGSCESSTFKIRLRTQEQYKGAWITVKTIQNNEEYQLGIYKVASDKPTADRCYRDIVAYDSMHDIINADVADWYNTLLPNAGSKVTMAQFRNSFFAHFGITQVTETLANDDVIIERTIEPESLSGKTVISAICELNGCFGHINNQGRFKYVFLPKIVELLYPANDLYPSDALFPIGYSTELIDRATYKSCRYEDFVVQKIDKLQIRQEEGDVGAIVGSGNNAYVVQDNFLVYGKDANELETIAHNLLEVIKDVEYRPFDAEALGNPYIEVGDAVRFHTKNVVVESYVLKRTLKGIQSMKDSYSANGEEYCSEKVNSVKNSIIQLKRKTNVLTRTVDETRSELTDLEKSTASKLVQTAEEIRAEVANTASGLYSEISQTADAIRLEVSDLSSDMHSEITQLSNAISLRVTYGEVQSMIDIAIDGITISASQISLEGYTTINGGFSVLSNGSVVISDGSTSARLSGNMFEIATSGNGSLRLGSSFILMYDAGYVESYRVASVSSGKLYIGDGSAEVSCETINGGVPITSKNIHEYI